MTRVYFLLFVFLFSAVHLSLLQSIQPRAPSPLQCLDNDGNAVDWWFIYRINNKLQYVYYDSISGEQNVDKLTPFRNKLLSNETSALGYTLNALWKNPSLYNWIAYNDEPPNDKTYSSYGHSKGVFAYYYDSSSGRDNNDKTRNRQNHSNSEAEENNGGFYLIHSQPKFPNFSKPLYNYDGCSITFAQTFLCLSFETFETFNALAYQLRFIKPKMYNISNLFPAEAVNNFTLLVQNKNWLTNTSVFEFETSSKSKSKSNSKSKLQELSAKTQTQTQTQTQSQLQTQTQTLTQTQSVVHVNDSSHSTQSFVHFAKAYQWDNDLYENLVSPFYNESFWWETWRRNPAEPSFCQPNYTWNEMNVQSVILEDGTNWKYTQDHGKSGCSVTGNLVCVGDINRMFSQYNRGGGTACLYHEHLWNAFHTAFINVDQCPPPPPPPRALKKSKRRTRTKRVTGVKTGLPNTKRDSNK